MGCCASANGDGGSGGVVAVDRARTETTELNKLQPANSTVGAAASNSGSVPQPTHDAKADVGPHSPTNGMVDTSDRYKKKAVLGVGASCKVLSVVEKATGKLFAMKVLDKREAFNKHLWEAECKILHTLKHPNILDLVESSEDSKAWYIITVMCTGGELFDRVSHGKFSERIAAMLTKEMLEAVQYCHKHHIVHRDLKPENFVFEGAAIESKMKLIDFGCALVVDDKELVKDVAGSPYYVAPEVLNPNFVRTGAVWKAADMWSVGVILYLFVCGRPPFFGDTQEQIFQAIRDGVYAYPRNIPLSSAVKDLIDSLLRKDPLKRLTATQCLEHEWIAGDAAPDKVLPESVVHSLGAFRHQQRLKKAVARVLAHRMTEADTEHLEIVFKKFDINGDGQLGRNEIEEMMKHIGKSAAEAKDLMAAIDDNGDGVISKEEFATALEVNRLGHNKAEIKASFDLFDVDHDGFVTAKEIERLCDFMRPEQVKQLIADVDTNNDGQINFAEWLAAMKDIGQKKPHRRTNIPGVAPEPGTQSASGAAAAAAVAGQPQTMQQAMALAAEKAAAKSAAAEAMVAAADGKPALPGTAPSPTPSPAKV